jgi:uncharacterized membrane protein YkvA (DUF1232 family)
MWLQSWRDWARRTQWEVRALYLACGDPRTPWYAKLLAVCIVTYALSPIDLIPDFIPVLGCLDDLILLPIGIVLALKTVPPQVMKECRPCRSDHPEVGRPCRRTLPHAHRVVDDVIRIYAPVCGLV